MKVVIIEKEIFISLYLANHSKEINKMFRKNVSYNNIKI